jgi:hypothetical protein
MFMPHLFRPSRNFAEAIGPKKEKVPLDADLNHLYIKRKEEKMLKAMCHDFKLDLEKPKGTPKGSIWSVATGEWVPRNELKLDTIFPFALGPMIAQEVSSRIFFRGVHNGMLLPPAVWGAFNNVSVTSKAKASESSLCKGCRYPSWSCRVLSPAWPPFTGSGLFTLVLDQGLLIGFLAVDTCHRPREVMSLPTDT